MNQKILDLIEITGKTVLSTIPIGGTMITCVWDTVKSNNLSKRHKKWEVIVESRLNKLEIELNDIGNNDSFTTCLLKATELAIKTSSDKKREFLANALVNSLNINFNETTILIFLNLIEEYTDLHMIILKFFSDPLKFNSVKNSNIMMGSPISLFYNEYPDFKTEKNLITLISKKLKNDGLLNSDLESTMSESGLKSKRTTELGDLFLEFFKNEN